MTTIELYNQAFMEAFEVEETKLQGLTYQSVSTWDSVGHMGLIAALEDVFDIMMESDYIINLSSYEKGKEILSENYNIVF